jgi:hypothetical protein
VQYEHQGAFRVHDPGQWLSSCAARSCLTTSGQPCAMGPAVCSSWLEAYPVACEMAASVPHLHNDGQLAVLPYPREVAICPTCLSSLESYTTGVYPLTLLDTYDIASFPSPSPPLGVPIPAPPAKRKGINSESVRSLVLALLIYIRPSLTQEQAHPHLKLLMTRTHRILGQLRRSLRQRIQRTTLRMLGLPRLERSPHAYLVPPSADG